MLLMHALPRVWPSSEGVEENVYVLFGIQAGWLEESGWRRTALCTIRHGGWIGTSRRDHAMSSIMYESPRGVVLAGVIDTLQKEI